MAGFFDRYKAALFALVMVGLSTEGGSAQEASAPRSPISIGGFAHQFISRARIHMNVCEQPACVPGSKVSYVLYDPESVPDFEDYKLAQTKVAAQLKARAPKGTVYRFGTPQRSSDPLFTIFTTSRETRSEDGTRRFTKSTVIYAKTVTFSVISSAQDEKIADANGGLFLVGLMTWSQTLKNPE